MNDNNPIQVIYSFFFLDPNCNVLIATFVPDVTFSELNTL